LAHSVQQLVATAQAVMQRHTCRCRQVLRSLVWYWLCRPEYFGRRYCTAALCCSIMTVA